ncbi:MAG: metallophosphoesterase, partial [Actinomycetota bacterium]|nr:metallophosphoesterase [Actinomycetota bacterium]
MASTTRGPELGTRVALAATVLFLVASWIGLVTASAVGSLGPHRAVYEITGSSSGVVDLGPLGTLEVDSPLPLRLGVRVTVQEVPADVTSIGAPVTLEGLSSDLDRYVQFFASPATFLQDAAGDLTRAAARNTVIAFVGLGAGLTVCYLALGAARRRELAGLAVRRKKSTLAGAVVVVALAGAVVATGPLGPDLEASQPASAIFDGTPLEGARLTGRLAGIVDTYGGLALDAYRDNEAFYAGAEESLRAAWAAREEQATEWARLLDLSERVSPLQRVMLGDPDSLVTMLVVSDLHCNVGMAPVVAAAVELSGAEVVLEGGDTTVNGTVVERYCV